MLQMAPLRQWGRNSSSSVDGSRDEALARRLLLHELEKHVGRFAWGADHSKRYAHKLHGWLRTMKRAQATGEPVFGLAR